MVDGDNSDYDSDDCTTNYDDLENITSISETYHHKPLKSQSFLFKIGFLLLLGLGAFSAFFGVIREPSPTSGYLVTVAT